MFKDTLLEREQEELLSILIEASRNVSRDKRQKFFVMQTFGGESISHPGLPNGSSKMYLGDVEALARAGLIALSYGSHGTPSFDVIPRGIAYYQEIKRRSRYPIERIQTEMKTYLDAGLFQQRHPRAFEKWAQAEEKLWTSDSQRELTTIGHLCREAMQDFATELVVLYQPPDIDNDKTRTVARVRAILDLVGSQLGKTAKPFLEALLAYWGTISDLAQRQEHGSQKEGEPLIWEDARRVVFQTAIVMFEIERSLVGSTMH